MKLENGNTYKITNANGVVSIIIVKRNQVFAENGAKCGSIKSFSSHPKFSTLKIEKIGA